MRLPLFAKAFCDICTNRLGSTPHLIGKAILLRLRKVLAYSVNIKRDLISTLKDLEVFTALRLSIHALAQV